MDNIIVKEDGNVVLLDFGFVSCVDNAMRCQSDFVNTVYMDPHWRIKCSKREYPTHFEDFSQYELWVLCILFCQLIPHVWASLKQTIGKMCTGNITAELIEENSTAFRRHAEEASQIIPTRDVDLSEYCQKHKGGDTDTLVWTFVCFTLDNPLDIKKRPDLYFLEQIVWTYQINCQSKKIKTE